MPRDARTLLSVLALRESSIEQRVEGLVGRDRWRAELGATVRAIGDAVGGPPDRRPQRVARAITSRRLVCAVPQSPAVAARSARFWRLRAERGEPTYEVPDESEREAAIRFVEGIARTLAEPGDGDAARLAAIAARPAPPFRGEGFAFPDATYSLGDYLSWDEARDGIPCQGCGRPYFGDEDSEYREREGEPWRDYRDRLAVLDAPFEAAHDGHGYRWRVSGGPLHCRRCCPQHPMSPRQIEELRRILEPPPAPVVAAPRVRHCGTCSRELTADHVCRVEDLPKRLRAVVEATVAAEVRRRESDE